MKENSKQGAGALVTGPSMERPRQRIVACAQDLFHRHGIRGVGVETIAEAAGTNKMTLYRHFGSKDDLIIEYLNYKGKKADEVWAEVEAASPGDPIGQLYVFVEKAARFIAEDERGCDLANAAVELTQEGHPGLRVIEEFKIRQRDRLAGLCRRRGRVKAGSAGRRPRSSHGGRAGQPPQRRDRGSERELPSDQPSDHCIFWRQASRAGSGEGPLVARSAHRRQRPAT